MPRGYSKKKDAIESPHPAPSPETVRTQIKMMSGHASEEEMAASLPDNTMTTPALEEPARTRRPRRTKEEMAAARAAQAGEADPNMSDPKYVKYLAEMRGFGGASLVKGGFNVAAIAAKDESIRLQDEEEAKLDGYFYVMSKKYNVLDPTNHWFTMALYFFGLLGSFIFARVAKAKGDSIVKQFTHWFGGEKEEEEPKDSIGE